MSEIYLTPKELSERWKCSISRLAHLRRIGSRPLFNRLCGIKYPLSEIEDIEKNNVKIGIDGDEQ